MKIKLEQKLQAEGELTVLFVDMPDVRKSYRQYILKDKSGKKYNLHFVKGEMNVLSGATIRTEGYALNQELVVAEAAGDTTSIIAPAPDQNTKGIQKTAIILLNFTDDARQTTSVEKVKATNFTTSTSTSAYFTENSYGQTTFEGDVFGWYTLNFDAASRATCDVSLWAEAAKAEAVRAGVNFSNYTRLGFVFPRQTSCAFAGIGTMGGNPSVFYNNGYGSFMNYAHEIGHNLGLFHANAITCGDKAIDSYANCAYVEYGDKSDNLGYWNSGHYTGAHKVAVDWLTSSQIQTVATNGVYTLAPIEFPAGTKTLRILKEDTNEWYYITYRQPIGFEAMVLNEPGIPTGIPGTFFDGASIHIWNQIPSYHTVLVDTTPGSALQADDSVLHDNATFLDPANGLKITQLSHSTSSVRLNIEFLPKTCIRANPSIEFTYSMLGGYPGVAQNFKGVVRNNDSTSCPSSTFSLGATVPTGFIAVPAVPTFTLAPGQSIANSLAVTPPANLVVVEYLLAQFTAIVTDLDGSRTGTTQGTYYVNPAPVDAPPSVSITSPANGSSISGRTVTISARATDNRAVSKVNFFINGKLVSTDTTAPYSHAWNVQKLARGTYVLAATAYDSSGKMASSSISVRK